MHCCREKWPCSCSVVFFIGFSNCGACTTNGAQVFGSLGHNFVWKMECLFVSGFLFVNEDPSLRLDLGHGLYVVYYCALLSLCKTIQIALEIFITVTHTVEIGKGETLASNCRFYCCEMKLLHYSVLLLHLKLGFRML